VDNSFGRFRLQPRIDSTRSLRESALAMKEKELTFGALLAIALIIGGLYVTRSKVLLYEFVEEDGVSGLPIWALLHPLRDRSPERSAEKILQALQEGRVEEALSRFPWPDADRRSAIRAEEAYYPIQAWKLVSRVDSPGAVKLYYSVTRRESGASEEFFSSPVWITLERSVTDVDWRAAKFIVVY